MQMHFPSFAVCLFSDFFPIDKYHLVNSALELTASLKILIAISPRNKEDQGRIGNNKAADNSYSQEN